MTDLKAVPSRRLPHARGLLPRPERGLHVRLISDATLNVLAHVDAYPAPELLGEWIRRQQKRAGAMDRTMPDAVVLLTHEVHP